MIPQTEIDHLSDLLKDFSTRKKFTPEEVFIEVRNRFKAIEQSEFINEICEVISKRPIVENSYIFSIIAKKIHKILYKGIFRNAGRYRRIDDPNKGVIYFGGLEQRSTKPKYTGTNPMQIKDELNSAYKYLDNENDPVESALKFYQRFVMIHPFYDANGRIARLLITVYLYSNKLLLDWSKIESAKGKFISKLNKCHDLYGTPLFEKYFKFFYDFITKYISEIKDQENNYGMP